MLRFPSPTSRALLVAAVITAAGVAHAWAMMAANAHPTSPVEWRLKNAERPGAGVGTFPPGALLVMLPEPCAGRTDPTLRWRYLGKVAGVVAFDDWPAHFTPSAAGATATVAAVNRRFVLRSAYRTCPPSDDGPKAV